MARRRVRQGPSKEWAFLTYIAGDNDLSDYGLLDIEEMCLGGASPALHIGAEIDTRGDHTGSIRYEITEPDWTGSAHRTVVERLPERNTGDPKTLTSFLEWGVRRFTARNYLVVIWNHGSGFRSMRRNIAYDDFGSSLDMPGVKAAFERAGIGRTRPRIRILGFDACLMNMVEIAYHFVGYVDYIVGSQQTEPGEGWNYKDVLTMMHKAKPPVTVAKSIVDLYIRYYDSRHESNVTQSAVRVSMTPAVIDALSKLGDFLAASMPQYRTILQELRLRVQSFEMADYVDLGHLAVLLAKHSDDRTVVALCRVLDRTHRRCVIKTGKIGSSLDHAMGLSVWFPSDRETFISARSKYIALGFTNERRGWVNFLDAYHSQ